MGYTTLWGTTTGSVFSGRRGGRCASAVALGLGAHSGGEFIGADSLPDEPEKPGQWVTLDELARNSRALGRGMQSRGGGGRGRTRARGERVV